MGNVSFEIPDDILNDVRSIASEQKISVDDLLIGCLVDLTQKKEHAENAMTQLREMSEKTQSRLGPNYHFNRDSLYER